MKFDWKYRYVTGGTKTDKNKRWALDLFVFLRIDKKMSNYKTLNGLYGKYIPIKIAVIRLGKNKNYKFYSKIIAVDNYLDGLVEIIIYSDDLNDLKKRIENNYITTQKIFNNCR